MKNLLSTRRKSASLFILAMFFVLCGGAHAAKAPREKAPAPDFTQGGVKDENHDWNLGPTGARGWIYGWQGGTSEARQILVTEVAKGSPADGVLAVGDVILGVGGKPFTDDARIVFARAVMAAEAEDAAGVLPLVRWRDGKTENVDLKLQVLGSYRSTAPYDCPKSRRIFDQGCSVIASKPLSQLSIPNDLNALALLASGEKEYLPMLADYARMASTFSTDSMQSWFYGFHTLFLAEYVAATGDRSVMDGLVRMAGEMARGQSGVGTWGHKFAIPGGNCNGYGCMNLPGIVVTTAMVVAREAGVKDPAVDRAIDKAASFLRWYVDKGAIPYGDHQPWPGHEDNGKCSSAAILFDLLGDRAATEYYAKMSGAAYAERERGHTGNFFNILWAVPGVARGGPLATGAYLREQAWYYDLAREWDGSFGYQGSPVGEEEHGKYTNWDCTGAYLLTYALPLKSLYLTGKKPGPVPAFDSKQVDDMIAAGSDYSKATAATCYQGRATEQLMAGLASWSPAVRKRSAEELGRREGNFTKQLLQMLEGPDRYARYGACEALGCLGERGDAAAPRLRAMLNDKDPWMQSLACNAIKGLGPRARKESVSDLLKMTVRQNPSDPRGMVQRAASTALFAPFPGSRGPSAILEQSLEGVDRDLLYPAIGMVLKNQDGAARGSLGRIYGKLTDRDLVVLMPDIIKAIEELAPSNEMFADGIRLAGLDLVSRLHIREGMPLCVSVIDPDRWGGGKRLPKCLEYLARYGTHAKEVLPQLLEMRRNMRKPSKSSALLDTAIASIEASKDSPKLLDLKDFSARSRSGR